MPPLRLPVGNNPTLEVATITSAHLFGASASTGDAPATAMPLTLSGVLANRDPARGQAIIGESGAATKLYAVGALIPGGARLHEVKLDRVILDRGGTLETLMLPRTTAAGAGPQRLPPEAGPTGSNFIPFMQLVNMTPVIDKNRFLGYRVFPQGPHGVTAFAQQKLHAGDLVTAVNGTSLEDQTHAAEVMQTLSSSGNATVTVMRNGQSMDITLNLAAVAVEADAATDAAGGTPGSGAPGTAAGEAPGLGMMNGPHHHEHQQ